MAKGLTARASWPGPHGQGLMAKGLMAKDLMAEGLKAKGLMARASWPGSHGQGPHGQGPHGQGPHGQGPHGQGQQGQGSHGQPRVSFFDSGELMVKREVDWTETSLKYTFTEVHIIHQRVICGRWRKTMWASALMCHPREAKRCYRSSVTAVNCELSRLQIPMLQQVHVDYFPGLPSVIVECGNPDTHVVTGLRHMAKNMRKNQGAGREKGAVRLEHRKIGVPISYCCKAATFPTKTMLHVFLTAATQRMRTAWRAVRWEQYFRRTYTYTERLSAEKAAQYGVDSLLQARWHYGMGSGGGETTGNSLRQVTVS